MYYMKRRILSVVTLTKSKSDRVRGLRCPKYPHSLMTRALMWRSGKTRALSLKRIYLRGIVDLSIFGKTKVPSLKFVHFVSKQIASTEVTSTLCYSSEAGPPSCPVARAACPVDHPGP
eukprot:1235945-Pyramimonas_sp.AAC.1